MVRFAHVSTTILLTTSVLAHPGGNTNREVLRRQAHLDHPNRRSVQACKRDLVGTGWVREQHQRRESRLHELRVAAGFAKEHEIIRRDTAEVEQDYGVQAACTLDPEVGEGPYCKCSKTAYTTLCLLTDNKGSRVSSLGKISSLAKRAPLLTWMSTLSTFQLACLSPMPTSRCGEQTLPVSTLACRLEAMATALLRLLRPTLFVVSSPQASMALLHS